MLARHVNKFSSEKRLHRVHVELSKNTPKRKNLSFNLEVRNSPLIPQCGRLKKSGRHTLITEKVQKTLQLRYS